MLFLLFPYGVSAENITSIKSLRETQITPTYPIYPTVELLTTGYTAHDAGETGKGITKSGTEAKYGTCAVDPSVFPLGTVFYVPGYGIAVADDTGGDIRGDHIDLFFRSKPQALQWGASHLTVTVF